MLILPFLINGRPGRIMGNEKHRKVRQVNTYGSQVGQQIAINSESGSNVNDLNEVLGSLGVGSAKISSQSTKDSGHGRDTRKQVTVKGQQLETFHKKTNTQVGQHTGPASSFNNQPGVGNTITNDNR